jgi:hypothetical protein
MTMKRKLAVLVLALGLNGCASMMTHYYEGKHELGKGNTARAEQLFAKGCQSGELRDRGYACNDLGVLYMKSGRKDAAINAYQRGARYGDMTAIQNLKQLGAPVPPSDLLPYVIQRNADNDAALNAIIQDGIAGMGTAIGTAAVRSTR